MSERIENCKIVRTTLGVEDHGLMTIWLHLEGAGWGIGFGGHALDGPYDDKEKRRQPHIALSRWVHGILSCLAKERWEDLPGTFIRARIDNRCLAIGHLLEDRWITPEELSGSDE